jgi:hypothetical protein
MEPRTLYLSATVKPAANGELVAQATLRSITKPAKEGLPTQVKEHFIANVRLTRAGAGTAGDEFTPPAADSLPIRRGDLQERSSTARPTRCSSGRSVSGTQCVALMAHEPAPNTEPADAESIMAPRLVELVLPDRGAVEHQRSRTRWPSRSASRR